MDAETLSALKTCGILILLLPLLGAVLAGGLGRPLLRGRSHFPVILGVLGAVICSFVALFKINGQSHNGGPISWMVPVYDWLSAGGGTWFKVSFLFDPLTCVMLATVTFISLLVVIYSRDYMRAHPVAAGTGGENRSGSTTKDRPRRRRPKRRFWSTGSATSASGSPSS